MIVHDYTQKILFVTIGNFKIRYIGYKIFFNAK